MPKTAYELASDEVKKSHKIAEKLAMTTARKEFLQELLQALEALPVKELGIGGLRHNCALSALAGSRGVDGSEVSPMVDYSKLFDVELAVWGDIVCANDLFSGSHAARYTHMHQWVKSELEKCV